ncbi:DUF5681 domain-containing protein [Acidocella aromatica]|uniref:DUF5681 domain-containing protein n=1 Tax=Acidocella aromatica TaxID=1303579 RepID=A0A840VHF1_9PROT|nr:DUF5681 domain-containing protein [Acidocella aromatica]MBB5374327.1 hypothetical protein [Acidocella aromatica]
MSEKAGKKQETRFKPGQSGNPAGKPKGTRNAALMALEQIGQADAEGILRAVITAAKTGDMQAAKIIMDRLWPVRRGVPVMIDLPKIKTASDVIEATAQIIEATARGEITTDEAAALAGLVEGQRKAIETHELEQRIAALEERSKQNG